MSPVSKASQAALAAHTSRRRDNVSARIEKALKAMRREGADITVSAVARRADVTRPSIHRRPELLALIKAHQRRTPISTAIPAAPDTGESSIVAALRSRVIANDNEIRELKAQLRERERTIAMLHGELDKLR
jgi:hypothetical protein